MRHVVPTLVVLLIAASASSQSPQEAAEVELPAVVAQEQPAEAASGIWLGIGPNMEILPLGTYRFIFVPANSADAVNVTTITTGVGGPGDPTPAPGDLSAKVAATLRGLSGADAAKTARNLIMVYEEFIKSADSGAITSPSQLATAIQMLTTITTTGQQGWGDFATLVSSTLAASKSTAASSTSLKAIVAELRKVN